MAQGYGFSPFVLALGLAQNSNVSAIFRKVACKRDTSAQGFAHEF